MLPRLGADIAILSEDLAAAGAALEGAAPDRGRPRRRPAELIAGKVIAYQKRKGRPKSGTDWRDLAELLLTFPDLKSDAGPVAERLHAAGVEPSTLAAWSDLVRRELLPEEDEGYGGASPTKGTPEKNTTGWP